MLLPWVSLFSLLTVQEIKLFVVRMKQCDCKNQGDLKYVAHFWSVSGMFNLTKLSYYEFLNGGDQDSEKMKKWRMILSMAGT